MTNTYIAGKQYISILMKPHFQISHYQPQIVQFLYEY